MKRIFIMIVAMGLLSGAAMAHPWPHKKSFSKMTLAEMNSHLHQAIKHHCRDVPRFYRKRPHIRQTQAVAVNKDLKFHKVYCRIAKKSHRRVHRKMTSTGNIPSIYLALFQCESANGYNARNYRGYTIDWTYNIPPFVGAGNFLPSTWVSRASSYNASYGTRIPMSPLSATPWEQYLVTRYTIATWGADQFPECTRRVGLQ